MYFRKKEELIAREYRLMWIVNIWISKKDIHNSILDIKCQMLGIK